VPRSFYQLLHQGRVVPADFIGFATSPAPYQCGSVEEFIPNHDELMSNFFAQVFIKDPCCGFLK